MDLFSSGLTMGLESLKILEEKSSDPGVLKKPG